MLEQFLWCEKYRPKRIADTILPTELKTTFQTFVDQKNVPNLLLTGGAGVGKTTVARAMLEELECDYIVINGSMNGNIDTLRNEILNFASAVSLGGGRKYVILDEADYLNSNSTQPALRNFMEEFSKNCGFILTCNYKNRIIKPLHSRCSVIDFVIPKDCKPKLAAQFFKRVEAILQTEQVKYDRTVVGTVIQKHFPDWRRVLNELQRYSATGAIDSGILSNLADVSINQVLQSCKTKDFDGIRKWVHDNSDQEQTNIFRAVYEHAHELADRKSIPELIVIIADYSYKAAFVADHEINLVAFFVELMMRIEWKD
jgi:DNA polymerase III delta prime subunit